MVEVSRRGREGDMNHQHLVFKRHFVQFFFYHYGFFSWSNLKLEARPEIVLFESLRINYVNQMALQLNDRNSDALVLTSTRQFNSPIFNVH